MWLALFAYINLLFDINNYVFDLLKFNFKAIALTLVRTNIILIAFSVDAMKYARINCGLFHIINKFSWRYFGSRYNNAVKRDELGQSDYKAISCKQSRKTKF
jgi:uncharacterized membrane protein